ncbi:MAG TPA: hypothetical protein VIM67_09940 [Terriglobus sp.]
MLHIPHKTMQIIILSTCLIFAAIPLAAQSVAPPATSTSSIQTPSNSGSANTLTGVTRYRAGMRGPRNTTAPATSANLSTVGSDITTDNASLPIAMMRNNALGIPSGAPIVVRLNQDVDSGHVHNGQVLQGTLIRAIGDAPAGSPVEITVVSAAAAGQMSSAGEISLQVTRINGSSALSQVITAQGKAGPRDVPDADPAPGTEAKITADQQLTLPAA